MEKVVDFFRLDFFFEGGGRHFYVFVSVRKAQVLSQFPLVALTTAQRFFNVHFLKCITPPLLSSLDIPQKRRPLWRRSRRTPPPHLQPARDCQLRPQREDLGASRELEPISLQMLNADSRFDF